MCVRFVLVLIVFLLTLTCCFSSRDTSSSDTNPTASGSGSESLSGGQSGSTKKPVDASKHTPSVRNETKHNENETATAPPTFYGKLYENKEMMMRAFYVLLAVTSIIVIYFGVKAWRTRKRGSKSRKYGLISSGADLEMEPLDRDDDDDDDMTVFERTK